MDLSQLMKQVQSMQKKMQEMQQEAASKIFEATSGGGLVKIYMTGNGEMSKISISPEIMNASEKETLEDLIIAAYNDAKRQADAESKDSIAGAFGGMPIPPFS